MGLENTQSNYTTQPTFPGGVPTQQAQQSPMDFMGLLGLLMGAQTEQLGMKLDALTTPQSKIVRKDISGNVIGNQPRGLDAWYAMNPGFARGLTYEQGVKNTQAMGQSRMAEVMNGLAGLFNTNLQQQNQFANAGDNTKKLPLNPFYM